MQFNVMKCEMAHFGCRNGRWKYSLNGETLGGGLVVKKVEFRAPGNQSERVAYK